VTRCTQCSFKVGNRWKLLGVISRLYGGWLIASHPHIYSKFLGLLCHVQLGIVKKENHTIIMETRTFYLPIRGSPCSTAVAVLPLHICLKSHDHDYYSRLLYTPTFEISMSLVSSIRGLWNFCDPPLYLIKYKKGKFTLENSNSVIYSQT
jgi:hypothetical protein